MKIRLWRDGCMSPSSRAEPASKRSTIALPEGLDKSVIRALAQKSGWVQNHENIFVLGPTGVGKSFVACALAQKARRDGYSALYTPPPHCFAI